MNNEALDIKDKMKGVTPKRLQIEYLSIIHIYVSRWSRNYSYSFPKLTSYTFPWKQFSWKIFLIQN